MPNKYSNRTALITYTSVFWGIAMFIISFILEGWDMDNIEKIFSHPVGILAIILIVGCIILFIWNLRREELTHEQWEIERDKRLSDLNTLEELLKEFKDYTNKLVETDIFYNLETYGLNGKDELELYTNGMFFQNKPYTKLCDNDSYLKSVKSDIEMLISKLGNKELKKRIHSLFIREQTAHIFAIFKALYEKHYNPQSAIEKRIQKSNSIPLFEQAFKRTYDWIEIMKRGKDLV